MASSLKEHEDVVENHDTPEPKAKRVKLSTKNDVAEELAPDIMPLRKFDPAALSRLYELFMKLRLKHILYVKNNGIKVTLRKTHTENYATPNIGSTYKSAVSQVDILGTTTEEQVENELVETFNLKDPVDLSNDADKMENQTNLPMGGSGSPANKITAVDLEVADALQDNDNSGVLVGPEQNMIVKEADKLLLSPFNPSTMENKNAQFRFG